LVHELRIKTTLFGQCVKQLKLSIYFGRYDFSFQAIASSASYNKRIQQFNKDQRWNNKFRGTYRALTFLACLICLFRSSAADKLSTGSSS
jgi:hypothetical protein